MKTLPTALIVEKNQLESTNPIIFLYELKIRTSTSPDVFTYQRVCNYDQNITFNSQTFIPFPVKLSSLSESVSGEITRMTLTIANVDQSIISLLENYWASVADPLWVVNIWIVDATNPTQTPVNSNETFEVMSVTTDLLTSTFDVKAFGPTFSRVVPGRNYTRNSNAPNIPRRIR